MVIPGITGNTYSSMDFNDGDVICVQITSSDSCANPSCQTIHVGVHEAAHSGIIVSPNPFKDELAVYWSGRNVPNHFGIAGASIQLIDVYGRVVYSGVASNKKSVINTRQISTANYILLLTDKDGARSTWKVVKAD